MAVYVDDAKIPYRGMLMSHMLADTDEELHQMADKIGVQRRWHQAPPKHESHYDIALSKRALAVKAGAVEITPLQAAQMRRRRIVTGELGKPEEVAEWYSQWRLSRGRETRQE